MFQSAQLQKSVFSHRFYKVFEGFVVSVLSSIRDQKFTCFGRIFSSQIHKISLNFDTFWISLLDIVLGWILDRKWVPTWVVLGGFWGARTVQNGYQKAVHVHVGVCACACGCVWPPRGVKKHPQRCQKAPPEAPKRSLGGAFGHLGGCFGIR